MINNKKTAFKNASVFPLVALIVMILLQGQLLAKDDLSSKQEELNKVYRELQQRKTELRATREKEKNVLQRLVVINREITKTQGQLDRAETQIDKNKRKLDFLGESLTQAKNRLENRGGVLRSRVREIFKNRDNNLLEMLISSDTLADFINKTYYFEKIMGRDLNLVNDITVEHKKINKDKNNLEDVTDEIQKLAKDIDEKKKYMEVQKVEKTKVREQLEDRIKEYEKQIAVLEQTSNQIEQLVRKMVAERASKGGKSVQSTGSFIWPLQGRLTAFFGSTRHPFLRRGYSHTGLDIANSNGTPIKAADSGEILFSGWWDGYGKAVIIDHGKSISTVYGHMSRIYVEVGQKIKKGEVIGLVGSTGFSTGPHLHFEVRRDGVPKNPLSWLPKR